MANTPEELAREQIDAQLEQCGWIVQDHRAMNLSAGPGVAIREFPLKTGFADYMLYADGKAIGIVEQTIGVLLVVVILVLVLIQVAQRYVDTFGGWPWTGEVARLSLAADNIGGYGPSALLLVAIPIVVGLAALFISEPEFHHSN